MAMSDDEVMTYLRGDSMLNRARRVLSGEIGRAEQAQQQRTKPTPIEMRRAEFEAVRKIAAELGITL